MESVLTLLLACSLHLDDALLSGVVEAFSGGNAFAVQNVAVLDYDDERLGLDEPPRSLEQARAAVARVMASGGEPVAGLLPLRPAWLADLQKPADALFDVCQVIEVASAKISEYDYQCRHLGSTVRTSARRACTLERYGASLGLPALGRFVMVRLASSPAPAPVPPVQSLTLERSVFEPGGIFFEAGGAP